MSRLSDRSTTVGEKTSTEQLREKAAETGQNLREVGACAKDAAQEQLGQLRDTATEYYQQGREKAVEWRGDVQSYIREEPVKSVLLAAGIGLILGFLWRRH